MLILRFLTKTIHFLIKALFDGISTNIDKIYIEPFFNIKKLFNQYSAGDIIVG